MNHTTELVKDHGYVRVVMTGDFTKNDFEICREDAARVLLANSLHRLFVDFTQAVNKMPFIDEYIFTEEHRFHFRQGTKIALVVTADEMKNLQTVENVSKNRGINLTLFSDEAQAFNWLVDK